MAHKAPGTAGKEVELKRRVDDLAALMRICVAAQARPAYTAIQRNRYLDTADRRLDGGRFVFRLRTEISPTETQVFVTAKGPSQKSADGTLSIVAEEEIVVDAAGAAAIEGTPALAFDFLLNAPDCTDARRALVARMREAVGDGEVGIVGGFTNERTRVDVQFPEGFHGTLELDRVHFPGDQIQHEVEFEVPGDVDVDVAKVAFEALFERANVKGIAAPGKAKRFFAALRGEKLS